MKWVAIIALLAIIAFGIWGVATYYGDVKGAIPTTTTNWMDQYPMPTVPGQ